MSTVTKTATAGAVDADNVTQLETQLALDTGIGCQITRYPDQDASGDPDLSTDRLVIDFDSPPDIPTVDATIAGFSPGIPLDTFGTLSPTPSSNAWVTVPDSETLVGEGRVALGTVTVYCTVGDDLRPAGTSFGYIATRHAGGSVTVATWGEVAGNIPRFGIRVDEQTDRFSVQIRRSGNTTIRLLCVIDRRDYTA